MRGKETVRHSSGSVHLCDGKVSVKVRTGFKKMWYNICAEKNGKPERIQEPAANLAIEKSEKVISCRQKRRNP